MSYIGERCGLALARCAASTLCFLTLSSFIGLHPLTNWFLCSFLSKRHHHTQNITLLSWSCLKPRVSLCPVAVKASSFGGRCCWIVALIRTFCLILAVDSRGDRGRVSALHKSKLLQTHRAVSSRVPLCAHPPSPPPPLPSWPGALMIAKNGARKREFSR